ncbi:MAG: hypothetical protein ACYSWQ_07175 [Planctomycetota bacterium]
MAVVAAIMNFSRHLLSLSWLTGPIFDKELRVSSRRRRNYALRFAYLSFLTFLLGMFWIRVSRQGGSGLYLVSRMADTGKMVIAYTVWFQFCVTQIIAVVMLSASISNEIYNRTLGLLMTTPITGFQIVMGKLFSKLLQLLLLLAISLPLLAVVRVFGGVPWGYVISSLCITVTTVIFVGSLSLFFSIFTRKSYIVIIVTFLMLGFLFALVPVGIYAIWDVAVGGSAAGEKSLMVGLFVPNPYCNMYLSTFAMANPRAGAVMPAFFWPLHCGIMLAASVLVLFLAVLSVRRVALRQATGQLGAPSRRRRSGKNAGESSSGPKKKAAATIRRVIGPAVLWKEMRLPLLGRRKRSTYLAMGAALAIVLASYYICHMQHVLDDAEIHIVYAIVYLGLGTLFTVVIPCTCITAEKEARSWPLLLVTTLGDRDILLGKLTGTLRRCLPVWSLLLGHMVVFSLAGKIHPLAIVQIGILVFWLVLFLSCSGLYFSSRCRSTTAAVIMNFVLALAIWTVVPLLLFLATSITNDPDIAEAYLDTNPLMHAGVILDATAGRNTPGEYHWVGSGSNGVFASTVWMLTCGGGYVLLGAIFAWRAQRRFRRNIF